MNTKPKQELATVESAPLTPMDMMQIAVEKGADIDQMQKIMDLQERYEAGQAKKGYVAAMMSFQAECPFIEKGRKGHNTMYANLADTLKQIKDLMKEHGFVHSWKTDQVDGQLTVTCCVTHKLGHRECSSMTAEADKSGSKNDVQAIGSTNTYLQRYTLFSVLGLASTEMDTDGVAPDEIISPELATELEQIAEEVGADKIKLCKYFKVDSIAAIPVSKYHNARQMLESKRKVKK